MSNFTLQFSKLPERVNKPNKNRFGVVGLYFRFFSSLKSKKIKTIYETRQKKYVFHARMFSGLVILIMLIGMLYSLRLSYFVLRSRQLSGVEPVV